MAGKPPSEAVGPPSMPLSNERFAISMLREGYGVEDVAVRMGRPVEEVRALVARLRRIGRLRPSLGTDVVRNRRALKRMGIGHAR